TAEVSFPLGLPSEYQILGKLFTDLGSSGTVNPSGPEVSDTGALRASIGTGVSWNSPFGLIGVDLGFPVLKDDDDITEIFRINFGARF
ncbi:MAG: BamA/TamA family outer membrane protein, partial [Rhodospirillales bacterium]|nr:BamA/TamA family outer membrane protein [Rhodospirillales bacterium]